jgi:hypothetical protein
VDSLGKMTAFKPDPDARDARLRWLPLRGRGRLLDF